MSRFRRVWRRARLGVPTVLGMARLGHFTPDRNAAAVRYPMQYGAVERLFARHRPDFTARLEAMDAYRADLQAIGGQAPPAPRWNQGWFPTLDAAVTYALIRTHRPARVVEIGSGHSTRFIARAIADGGLATRQIAIDPAPRAVLAGLAVQHLATPVQRADPAVFTTLEAGDVLFIDSSHIAMPGSDVDLLLNQIVPDLPAGVLLHIHDIHLPDDYPATWRWRGYSEHCAVVPLVTGGGFVPLFASHYAQTRMAEAVAASVIAMLPAEPAAPPGSLWLEKRTTP